MCVVGIWVAGVPRKAEGSYQSRHTCQVQQRERYFHCNNLPSFISLWTTEIPPNYDFNYLTVSIFMFSTAMMSFFVLIYHLSGSVSFPCIYIYCILFAPYFYDFDVECVWRKYFGLYEYLNFNGYYLC